MSNNINIELDVIAIVGMSGRFPGARNIDELWKNLCNEKQSIKFFNDDELDPSIDVKLKSDPNYVKARGIIEDADKFDAAFFGITPREAEIMDPQHRIFLETAWHAVENAGYNIESYDGLIGVFTGSGINSYFTQNVLPQTRIFEDYSLHHAEILNAPDYLATRVSYKLNLKGPSISIYTGCSTSLVAVCLGFDSLMSYQCDMAIVGGVYIVCPQYSGYLYQDGEMFSIDGYTRPFDQKAQGAVFSSGVGAVVLKRLENALNDRDFIYAVIRGVALNNDGADKMSFTAPSVQGQAEVIAMAHANAGVSPDTISYVETHGTATPLGDPIEIAALTQAFQAGTTKKNYCAIGSVKSNIGHLDSAAGIAGLIKTSLALQYGIIPASINFQEPNPKIDFENSPFFVQTKTAAWKSTQSKRRAGVSSFGVGGTNSHVILEEAPQRENSGPSRPWNLLLFSAKTETALENIIHQFVKYFKIHSEQKLADVAYTLQVGRKHFNYRRIAICHELSDTIESLETLDPAKVYTSQRELIPREVVFLFSGQGSQYVNMGRDLYFSEPIFRREIDSCARILESHLELNLREILYPEGKVTEKAEQTIKQTYITQPALFAIEYALAKLWMAWGVVPRALIGHSIGEYVAACLAGVFTLEEALSLVATRGKLIQELPPGSMLAVFLPEKEVQPLLIEGLSISAVNGLSLCVISGGTKDIDELERTLLNQKIACRRLHTSHAFHSYMMEPILDAFYDHAKKVSMKEPEIPFLSNVTGTWIKPHEVTQPDYWVRHLRNTVRFNDGLAEVFKDSHAILLEIGPGNTFSTIAHQHSNKAESHLIFSSLRHPKNNISDAAFILATLGKLWLAGIGVDWAEFNQHEKRNRVPIPGYGFDHKRHWIEAPTLKTSGSETQSYIYAETIDTDQENEETDKEKKPDVSNEFSLDETEKILENLWKRILGYKHIGINDNYFEIGGSSLMAVRMFTQVEKIFGKRLPLATLYEAPTIGQLAELLKKRDYSPNWSPLVEINPGNLKPPLFMAHAEGGNVLEYFDLANNLGKDQPFYGLQALGLKAEEIVQYSIEEMATHFIKEIKKIQPSGPYYIGGYCLGGLVAYEMAQQLIENQEDVAFLAMISTSTPDHIRDLSINVNAFKKIIIKIKERIALEVNNMSTLTIKAKILYIFQRAKRISLIFQTSFEGIVDLILKKLKIENKWRSRAYVLQASVDLTDDSYMSYKPKPIKKNIVLFRVSERTALRKNDPYLGWKNLALGGTQDFEVFGFHKNILKEPNVRTLADKLGSLLNDAQKAHQDDTGECNEWIKFKQN